MQFAVCGRDSLSLMFRFVIGWEVEMLRYFLQALQRAISRANVAKCVVRPKSLYFWPWKFHWKSTIRMLVTGRSLLMLSLFENMIIMQSRGDLCQTGWDVELLCQTSVAIGKH